MAQIINTQDPWHDDLFVCSNCHAPLFTAHIFYEPAKTEQNTTAEIIFGFFRKNKGIPNLCPKCLEPLEFPSVMEMKIRA